MQQIPILDTFAWWVVRVTGLVQLSIGEVLLRYYKPKSIYEWADIIGLTESGRILFNSHSPDDLPSIVAGQALLMGRVIVILQVSSLVVDALKLVLWL